MAKIPISNILNVFPYGTEKLPDIEEDPVVRELLEAHPSELPLADRVCSVRCIGDGNPVIARIGETIEMEARLLNDQFSSSGIFKLILDAPISWDIAQIRPERAGDLLRAEWKIELPLYLPAPARFKVIFVEGDELIVSENRLAVYDTLEVTILDEFGDPLDGKAWTATTSDGSKSYSGVTDDKGRIFLEDVLAGEYTVSVSDHNLTRDEEITESRPLIPGEENLASGERNTQNVVMMFAFSTKDGFRNIETDLDPIVRSIEPSRETSSF